MEQAGSPQIQELIKLGLEKANTTTCTLIEYDCDLCKDTGFVDQKIDGRWHMQRCECFQMRQTQRRLKNSGLKEAFKDITFENTDCWNTSVKECVGKAKKYVDSFNETRETRSNSMLLLGQVGSGKTHIAIAVTNALMEQGTAVMYIHFKELIRGLKGNCLDEAAYSKNLHRLVAVPVLFIDDLFKEYTTADVKYVYEVVNERYMRNKPMIVTSEVTPKGLLEIDEAVGSRLIEMSSDFRHMFPNEIRYNYRLRSLVEG